MSDPIYGDEVVNINEAGDFQNHLSTLYGLGYRIVPARCHCGGSHVWAQLEEGGEIMKGCICHSSAQLLRDVTINLSKKG